MTTPEQDDSRKPPRAICLAAHPLLSDVRCGRLTGHPGRHEAETKEGVGVTWQQSREQAG